MSYSGAHELLYPLPSKPTIIITDCSFDNRADDFFDAISYLMLSLPKEKQWVCSYCRTKTNLLTYKQQGSKSCYNCGSNEGEIK